jgi:hypothetical protein
MLNQHVLVLKAMGFWYSTSPFAFGNQSHGLLKNHPCSEMFFLPGISQQGM